MQVFNKKNIIADINLLRKDVQKIIHEENKPSKALLSNGEFVNLGCLNCSDKRCMFYNSEEIEPSKLANFPFDKNRLVCPIDAISTSKNGIIIDSHKCLKCGLCASRCVTGAIYFEEQNLKINYDISMYEHVEVTEESIIIEKDMINKMATVPHEGFLILENENMLSLIIDAFGNIDSKKHDLIGRNLLIAIGCKSGKRRIGDVYTRTDAIYETNKGILGAVEVEFGRETLDASRAILDDIATLNVRYSLPKELNYPIVICLQLPNARQGYWQVIKDINNVENIKIQTITVGALLMLVWNFKKIELNNLTFYIDFDNKSLRSVLETILSRTINISDKFLGILEPSK